MNEKTLILLTALWNRNRAKCLQNFSTIVDPCTGDIAASNLPEAFRTASVSEEVCNSTCIQTKFSVQEVVCHKLVLKSVSYPKIVKNTPILIEQSIACNVYT